MLARKAELYYYPEEIYEDPRKKDLKNDQNKKNNKKNKKNSKLNAGVKILCLFSGLLILGISLFILIRYANITKMRMELTQIERQIVELEKTKLDLVAELEGIKSSQDIIDQAIHKLGMNYPKEDQIAYVSVKPMDPNLDDSLGNKTRETNTEKVFSLISTLF